jgi:hypothetical protein
MIRIAVEFECDKCCKSKVRNTDAVYIGGFHPNVWPLPKGWALIEMDNGDASSQQRCGDCWSDDDADAVLFRGNE